MARRTYGENERTTVERDVKDMEVIEAFVEELDGSSSAEEVLEDIDDTRVVKATAEYSLIHPYEGENFSEYLIRGEDVTARVEFYLGPEKSDAEVYTGHVSYDARDIFSPAAVVGMHEDIVKDSMEESLIERDDESAASGSQLAETD